MRSAIGLLLLASCNHWVRPSPPPAESREIGRQRAAAVKIIATCDPFEDGGKTRFGTGVMVSEWQVLTALHVVDCQSAITQIRVMNSDGRWWKFVREKEWVFDILPQRDGIARIQLATSDTLQPRISPPALAQHPALDFEPFFIQSAQPEWQTILGEATGRRYGDTVGSSGALITYHAETQEGNSGSAIYDINGDLYGLHLGQWASGVRYAGVVTSEMVPHK
jgi:S1-C subfamily serine protease